LQKLPIEDSFRAVLRKMTTINPEDRYQSLEDVERDLNKKSNIDNRVVTEVELNDIDEPKHKD